MIFNDMVVENRLFLNKMRTKKYNILYEKENDFKLTYNILYCALLFEFYRSAVSNHFRGTLHHCGRRISDVDHRIRIHLFSFRYHALCGKGSCFVHHFRIGAKLAAYQRLKALGDIFADIFGLYGTSLDKPKHFQFFSGDVISIY